MNLLIYGYTLQSSIINSVINEVIIHDARTIKYVMLQSNTITYVSGYPTVGILQL